jgi:hypothetical protein
MANSNQIRGDVSVIPRVSLPWRRGAPMAKFDAGLIYKETPVFSSYQESVRQIVCHLHSICFQRGLMEETYCID